MYYVNVQYIKIYLVQYYIYYVHLFVLYSVCISFFKGDDIELN